MPVTMMNLDSLHITTLLQPRGKSLCKDAVTDYTAAAKAGAVFPPLLAYKVTDRKFPGPALVAGFHRHKAFKAAELTECEVELREGTFAEAWLAGFLSNSVNGLRYSREQKRHAVEQALLLFKTDSARQLAERLGVSHPFVQAIRKELVTAGKLEKTETVTGKDGREQSNTKDKSTSDSGGNDYHLPQTDVSESGDVQPDHVADGAANSDTNSPDDSSATTSPTSVSSSGDDAATGEQGSGKEETTIVQPTQVDGWGIPIQPHAVEAFAALPKFKELVSAIQHAQRLFNEVANTPGGQFLTLPDVSSFRRGKKGEDGEHASRFVHPGLETAYQQVKAATPTHTVCPWNYVEAGHPEKCRTCNGLNWTPVLGSNIPPAAVAAAKEAHGV